MPIEQQENKAANAMADAISIANKAVLKVVDANPSSEEYKIAQKACGACMDTIAAAIVIKLHKEQAEAANNGITIQEFFKTALELSIKQIDDFTAAASRVKGE